MGDQRCRDQPPCFNPIDDTSSKVKQFLRRVRIRSDDALHAAGWPVAPTSAGGLPALALEQASSRERQWYRPKPTRHRRTS
jgi:hypothetical protein